MKKSPFISPVLYWTILNSASKLNKIIKQKGRLAAPTETKQYAPKIKLYCRNTALLANSVGFTFRVHTGRVFLNVYVSEKIIGHKLGEFSQTRRRNFFKKKVKNKKKR